MAASITRDALERARAEREPIMGFEQRQKEAREGINQLGLSLGPMQKPQAWWKNGVLRCAQGWGWCVKGRQPLDLAGEMELPLTY